MYGGYYGAQLPIVGNKGISMLEGKFSMHGKTVQTTWTNLETTANVGDTSITLQESPDW